MRSTGRYYFLICCLILGVAVLVWRMLDLNIFERQFLLAQSNARILRVVNIPAYRGMITDRFNQPLAISAQVNSIWVNPQLFLATHAQLKALADILKIPVAKIIAKTEKNTGKEFIYLKRGVSPAITEHIKAMEISGIFFQPEYHRFYPQSDVTAHVIGFTNVDDEGQEGLELAFNNWLNGVPGKKKIIKDRLGNIVAELEVTRQPRQGHDLTLSIDSRIQFLAYEELKTSLENFKAESGSIVVLDAKTGEVLAMVNQPGFNPNHIEKVRDGRYRNRAVTDLFEPGSTIKAFSIGSALESGQYTSISLVDTSPGYLNVAGNLIKDEHNNGPLTLTSVLQRSSDVGVAKVTLSLDPQRLPHLLQRVGFGDRTASAFPGEATGQLPMHDKWRPFELATLSFGYGISVTALQLAQAYLVIANQGMRLPISLIKQDQMPTSEKVIDEKVAVSLLKMLETVVQDGTGKLAKVQGYRVAGKTGTAYIAGPNGYDKQHYVSSFVGIAPVTDPKLVVVVVIKDPKGEQHMGGMVAAPTFAKVMGGALRLLNVTPDDLM